MASAKRASLRARTPTAEDEREVLSIHDAVAARVRWELAASFGTPRRQNCCEVDRVDDAVVGDITRAQISDEADAVELTDSDAIDAGCWNVALTISVVTPRLKRAVRA
jgi:hypothetical protein